MSDNGNRVKATLQVQMNMMRLCGHGKGPCPRLPGLDLAAWHGYESTEYQSHSAANPKGSYVDTSETTNR